MSGLAPPLERVIRELSRLPGIGKKTAQRLTFFLLKAPPENVIELAMLFADGEELSVGHLPDSLSADDEQPIRDYDTGMKSIVRRATARIERELIKILYTRYRDAKAKLDHKQWRPAEEAFRGEWFPPA